MRLIPIIAAATVGLFAATAVNAQGMMNQQRAKDPAAAADTATKGNPNEPSAGQTMTNGKSTMGKSTMHKTKKHKKMMKKDM